jgi:hypothetical protein
MCLFLYASVCSCVYMLSVCQRVVRMCYVVLLPQQVLPQQVCVGDIMLESVCKTVIHFYLSSS